MLMLRNGSLNQGNIGLGDGPFPDGNGQHFYCISEMRLRRQEKNQNAENIFCEWIGKKFRAEFWVEMKKDGLKTGVKPGILEY